MRSQRGQSTVELAAALPLVLVVALVLVQLGAVLVDQVGVVGAAREAARAVAVDPAADVSEVAAKATSLDRRHLTVRSEPLGDQMVAVEVSYTCEIRLLPTSMVLLRPTLRSRSVMHRESG